MLREAERRFLVFAAEVTGERRRRPGVETRAISSESEPSSSAIANSASVIRALRRLFAGTMVWPECDDSARETGRGERVPDKAFGRMVT